ncbi:MAG: phospholipase A [Burkholderiales bacterium]|nr:phospholipase A [Burkholderiales bacterium]
MIKSSHRLAGAMLLTALGATGATLAQTTPSIAECAAIGADSERLACYDRASGRAVATPPGEPPAAAGTPAPAVAGTGAPVAGAAGATRSMIDTAWAFDPGSNRYVIDVYKQNYLLVGRYTDNLNTAPYAPLFAAAGKPETLDSMEAKFQLSFKMRLWTTEDRRWGVWAAYTQQNQWQVYNGETSRPFRETNYMPELFASYRPGLDLGGGFRWNLLNVGYNHQSNGRTDILSRSWDRIIATFGFERENFALLASAWYPFYYKDDNPTIKDYYGYGSLTAIYKWRDHSLSLMGRGNLSKGKGAAELTWMSPRLLGPVRAYVQGFAGYGESMIDYNWNQKTIGVGIALNDAL